MVAGDWAEAKRRDPGSGAGWAGQAQERESAAATDIQGAVVLVSAFSPPCVTHCNLINNNHMKTVNKYYF